MFKDLMPHMTNVIVSALDEEKNLEDALVQFNELAEVEPNFFKGYFSELFQGLKPIVERNDFCNPTIRHQPLEFLVTLIERIPSVIKKDNNVMLQELLDVTFKLMIDIDEDIEQEWLSPKPGHSVEEEEEDNVKFGQTVVDRLISCIGEDTMLPLIGTLVQNTIANEQDWRFKHAGIMAFSQVGEYVEETEKIDPMIPVLL
jgi:hypothetical protein